MNIAAIAAVGLNRSTAQFEASAKRVASGNLDNLPDDIVTQKLAAASFKANLVMLKTADEMTKSVLDILA